MTIKRLIILIALASVSLAQATACNSTHTYTLLPSGNCYTRTAWVT
jgi:hypothetical protein